MLVKVISGGQTGADIAGLRAARAAGLPTGGYAPKGWLIEGPGGKGVISCPSLADYGMVEHTSDKFPPRTFANVNLADATILFVSTRAKTERGCDLTKEACAKLGKRLMVISVWSVPDSVPTTDHVAQKIAWLVKNQDLKCLNIAGTRGSSDPGEPSKPWTGIEGWCELYLFDVFTLLKESEPNG